MTTVEIAPRALRPPVRVRRPPQYEPPFDDERPSGHETSADQLALSWPARSPAPAPVDEFLEAEEQLRAHPDELTSNGLGRAARMAVIAARAATAEPPRRAARNEPDQRQPSRHPAAQHPAAQHPAAQHQPDSLGSVGALSAEGDARLAVRRFVTACVEVFNGYRPAAHLRRLSLPAEAARVTAQAMAGAHRVSELRRLGPKRQIPRARRRPTPVAVLRVQLCEPRPGAIEASVVLVTGDRTWALALRMESHEEAWLATALRLV
jgi:hypothetical protein